MEKNLHIMLGNHFVGFDRLSLDWDVDALGCEYDFVLYANVDLFGHTHEIEIGLDWEHGKAVQAQLLQAGCKVDRWDNGRLALEIH